MFSLNEVPWALITCVIPVEYSGPSIEKDCLPGSSWNCDMIMIAQGTRNSVNEVMNTASGAER